MSDVSLLLEEDDGYIEADFVSADKDHDSSDRKFAVVKVIFLILCFVLAAELVAYKYVVPMFSSPKITVSGNKTYTAEELARLLLPMDSRNWLDFDIDRATAILSSVAGIESVSVEKALPDRIMINVEERAPVAVTFVVEDGRTAPVHIDRNGVIFSIRHGVPVSGGAVPIVSGLPVEHLSDGMRIPEKYRPLIGQIASIESLPQKYFAAISEICVIPKEYGNYELALIPAQSKIRVLTDRSLNEEALKYMMVVLDIVKMLGSDVSEVDLRYGSVSYRTK